MKFAKYLSSKAVADWSNYYLDYKRLKKTLEPLVNCIEEHDKLPSGSTEGFFLSPSSEEILINSVLDFQEVFKEEVDKVEFFCHSRLKHCKSIFQQITMSFFELKYPPTLATSNSRARNSHYQDDQTTRSLSRKGLNSTSQISSRICVFRLENLSVSVYELTSVLKHLKDNFIPLNKLAVYKIFKKHDKLTSKIVGLFPDAFGAERLAYSEEILLVTKQERKFYYRFKDDANYLLEEVQHLQHELNRLTIRKRQDGLV
ncbi:hypothetical protein DSO57_1039543 [Entomophthora muscae]|uniref:Uncharacterized protein n=1 Tax=Entomophthora muscae TaxID=34485 RepID=A0ACC2SMS4_9FUNG|nr:hypothetical protein DSO57_1039543 [Entomophthora muscae]